jgi:hypothetical protein
VDSPPADGQTCKKREARVSSQNKRVSRQPVETTAFKSPLRTSRDDTSRVGTRTHSTSTSHTIEWASQSCSTAS